MSLSGSFWRSVQATRSAEASASRPAKHPSAAPIPNARDGSFAGESSTSGSRCASAVWPIAASASIAFSMRRSSVIAVRHGSPSSGARCDPIIEISSK